MGLIKEPLDVDFYVDPTPLTKEEELKISEFIRLDKLRRMRRDLIKKKRHQSEEEKHFAHKK